MRRSLDRGELFRRRLSSEQACNISRKGSCQLSNAMQQLSPTDILLQIANQENPEGSADASSGAWGSCSVETTHSEQQLIEVTSPRKAQQLLLGDSARTQLHSLLGWRQSFSQEACTPVQGTCTAHPAVDPLLPGRHALHETHSALADGAMPQLRENEQTAMQQAGPVPANLGTLPEQHASQADPISHKQASWMLARQEAEGLQNGHMRDAGGLGSLRGAEVPSESQVQAARLPFWSIVPVTTGPAEPCLQLDNSARPPRAGPGQGAQAMGEALSAQQPEMPSDGADAERQTQRALEAPGATAEAAVRSFSTIWQQRVPAYAHLTGVPRPPFKPPGGTPPSAQAATQAGYAVLVHATSLRPPEVKPEPCDGLTPASGERRLPAALRPVHVVPAGLTGMPPFMSRPRSACSPVAAAMQSPQDSTPPPAWGNTF